MDKIMPAIPGGSPAADRGLAARAGHAVGVFSVVLLSDVIIGCVSAVLLYCALLALAFSPLMGLGLPFLAITMWLARPLARLQRRRVRFALGTSLPETYRPLSGSPLARVRTVLTDSATWRDLAWLAVQCLAGILAFLCLLVLAIGVTGVAAPLLRTLLGPHFRFTMVIPVTNLGSAFAVVPLGAVFVVAGCLACRLMADGSLRVSAWVLAPGEQARLRARMEHLAETRAEALDARAAEIRRIERDLHDGAQARLVSLAMSLGMAEEEIDRDPEAARQLVIEARASARTALTELRHLVRGIHPPVLVERGLAGAIQTLALASPVPVEVDAALGERLPAPIESAMYFVIAEALANISRHSNASWAFVRLWREDGKLRLLVRDDGRGGADPSRGSGLRGIQRRLTAFDGQLVVTSPVGGPTELFAELACPA